MAIPRETKIQLTEQQRAKAYTPEQIGEALHGRLKEDPNFALMSIFCTNSGRLFAKRVEILVPEQGAFEQAMLSFENKMWNWEHFDYIALAVKEGYQNDMHRILSLHIPFPDESYRIMSKTLKSGTREEILQYLQSSEFGPELMIELDDINVSMGNHD